MDSLFNHQFPNLIYRRREVVFLMLAGLFLSTFALLNVLGLTRIINLSLSIGGFHIPAIIPLGVLPYPITFICIDLITEFYGKERAKMVIWMGLAVNLWIALILWASAFLPPHVTLDPLTHLPPVADPNYPFFIIREYTITGIFGSVTAYLVAQLLDVNVFSWCKNLTKGKHLWLRSNVSTLLSQMVDTVIVISFSFYFTDAMSHLVAKDENTFSTLVTIILSGYVFKTIATILSTFPFYLCVHFLRNFLAPTQHPSLTPLQTTN